MPPRSASAGTLRRSRGRQGSVGADPARCRAGQARQRVTVEVSDGTRSRSVAWTVYDTGPRKAKNVILFIGDGLSPAHRVAARIAFQRVLRRARASASSRSTTCRTWRWWRPRAPIRSSPIRRIRPAPTPPATRPPSTRWASMRPHRKPVRRSRRSRPSPASRSGGTAWRSASSPTPRSRMPRRRRWWRTPAAAPPMTRSSSSIFAAKPDVLMGGGQREFPAADRSRLQTQGRRRLHRPLPRRRLSGGDDEVELDASAPKSDTRQLLGLFATGQHGWRAGPQVSQGRRRQEVSRTARPDRTGAGGAERPVEERCRLLHDGGVRDDRQIRASARHGARRSTTRSCSTTRSPGARMGAARAATTP